MLRFMLKSGHKRSGRVTRNMLMSAVSLIVVGETGVLSHAAQYLIDTSFAHASADVCREEIPALPLVSSWDRMVPKLAKLPPREYRYHAVATCHHYGR